MSIDYQIRLATPGDAPPIARFSRDFIESGLGWSWTPSRVQQGIHRAETVVLVADVHDQIAGFAIMEFGDDDAHLSLLGVRPRRRRSGIGTALVRWLESSCRIAGTLLIRLEVRESNQVAQRFYQRLGYRRFARLVGYYRGREHAIQMGRDLNVTVSRPSD